jgi:hypothetical protein
MTARRKKAWTKERIIARDRRMSAIHEAGHVVVARMLGVPVWNARIFPNADHSGDLISEKLWLGRLESNAWAYPTRQRQMIGVAGAVAEICWQGEPVYSEYWWEPKIMSASDWKVVDCPPGEPDQACCDAIEEVAALLERDTGPLWPSLIRTARALIVESRPLIARAA